MKPSALIATTQLSIQIGKASQARQLVNQLDWQVHAGECWVVIGRNGAGKSSLLKTIANLLPLQTGALYLQGQASTQLSVKQRARCCAYLPQHTQDAFDYTALDLVLAARAPQVHGFWEDPAAITAAYQCLAEQDLSHLAGQALGTLSGGERQRVAIAALFAQDAPLLLLDEPTHALDLPHQVHLTEQLQAALNAGGQGMVIVTHDLQFATQLATHVLLLNTAGTWLAGSVDAVLTAENLSHCLGYPLQTVMHQGRPIFLPGQTK